MPYLSRTYAFVIFWERFGKSTFFALKWGDKWRVLFLGSDLVFGGVVPAFIAHIKHDRLNLSYPLTE